MTTDNLSKSQQETWYEIVLRVLKSNDVSLITYVPDKVLAPLIKVLHADPYFTVIAPAREEEAIGIITGSYMAYTRIVSHVIEKYIRFLPVVLSIKIGGICCLICLPSTILLLV